MNTDMKGVVRLILNGANLSSSTSAPIYVVKAEKTVIIVADNTQNWSAMPRRMYMKRPAPMNLMRRSSAKAT